MDYIVHEVTDSDMTERLSLSFLLKGGAHGCPGFQGLWLWPQDQAPPPLHPLNQNPCHESPSGPLP